jgi:hypothetical protein
MTETYSVSVDFSGVAPNPSQLEDEIINNQDLINAGVIPNFQGIRTHLDEVYIDFSVALNASEKTVLNGIVSSHVPVNTPSLKYKITLFPDRIIFKNSVYTLASASEFDGGSYAIARSISYMKSGVTSYDIQIIDKNNKTVLLTKNLTNTDQSLQDLGVLTNLPSDRTQIEISVRKNGGSKHNKVFLYSVTIEYV